MRRHYIFHMYFPWLIWWNRLIPMKFPMNSLLSSTDHCFPPTKLHGSKMYHNCWTLPMSTSPNSMHLLPLILVFVLMPLPSHCKSAPLHTLISWNLLTVSCTSDLLPCKDTHFPRRFPGPSRTWMHCSSILHCILSFRKMMNSLQAVVMKTILMNRMLFC